MHRILPFLSFLLLTVLTGRVPAQIDVLTDTPWLTPSLATTTRALATPPRTAAGLAGAVLHALRADDRARTTLGLARLRTAAATTEADPDAVAWAAAAHLWAVRAYDRQLLDDASLAMLLDAVERRAAEPLPDTFAAAALCIHMELCAAELRERTTGDGDDRRRRTARALARLDELERATWQPGRGHYRPRSAAGAIALPALPDASLLVPAAAGMLVGTADRVVRHLGAVLAAPELAQADPHRIAAAIVCRDDATRAAAFAALLDGEVCRDPERAGFAADALCQAITGHRLAVGAGVDERWVRFVPWLPAGPRELHIQKVRALGATFALRLQRGDDDALQVRVQLLGSGDGQGRQVVVQCGATQTVAWLQPGDEIDSARP